MTSNDPPGPLAALLTTLDLDSLGQGRLSVSGPDSEAGERVAESVVQDVALFRGPSQRQPHGRVFGGQVLAQSVIATGRTVDPDADGTRRALTSIHAYFMRPGDDTEPITFSVERLRDGRSFSTRRVHALQHGLPIMTLAASFQRPDQGLDHQDAAPDTTPPDDLPTLATLFAGVDSPRLRHLIDERAIDIRYVDAPLYAQSPSEPRADQRVWLRARGRLPDDPLIHEAVLAYASDFSILEPVLRRHSLTWREPHLSIASLDHAMWFHRPARADDWILYDEHSPSAQGGRGLSTAKMYTQNGLLAASVAQEGMVRVPRADGRS